MKTEAYYLNEAGYFSRISAKEVKERERRYPGQWQSKEYYPYMVSKFPMFVRGSENVTDHFVFKTDSDKEKVVNQNRGESKQHYLLKMGLSRLKSTTLQIKGFYKTGQIHKERVTFKNMEIEHLIKLENSTKYYRIDVFGEFNSDGVLQEKWGGKIGIEIVLSNDTKGQKQGHVQELGIPLLDFRPPNSESFKLYNGPTNYTDKKLEENYIKYISNFFQNFLTVESKSNPSSEAHLRREISNLLKEKELLSDKVSEQDRCIQTSISIRDQLQERYDDLEKRYIALQSKLKIDKEDIKNLNSEISTIKSMGILSFATKKLWGDF